ncbi:Copper amine oxidase N-terminal domain-containing protein [Anaerosphaera aminiphila DSM 21120]|uniref:Copper amine oxidase N-terminal domain-containing protein n=1 Tax=Anaerosphaera aminiphila DSM 21120 TaxID=1120995 RepID=A0A1M5UBS7_9FIRM|nr:hypothetical protein [Anaerosphaera aminiphila]SHH60390.1 Copper amine oxidase N-terminal domain-containing protein [Anaerosphaera aminiphila DSM 21120]
MKKTLLLSLLFVLLLGTTVSAKVVPTDQDVTLDGQKIELEGYSIDGNNYFKLRDIAAILSGTDVAFGVDYNDSKNSIEITRNKSYTKLPTDLTISQNSEIESKKSSQKVYIDGEVVNYSAYFINGNNYYKLRDLGKTIGFYVDYKEDTKTIVIKSEKVDATDLIEREDVSFKSFAVDTLTNMQEFKIGEKKSISMDDFTSNIKSVVLLSTDERQFSAKVEYDESSNSVKIVPLLFKIKGSLNFTPVIKVEQGEETHFESAQSNLNLSSLTSKIDPSKEHKIVLGYYVGDESPENFRSFSILEFKN